MMLPQLLQLRRLLRTSAVLRFGPEEADMDHLA
jgi:hypothetical protein